ncbi:MAG: hypothetical protein NVSMB55_10240 [Mycobacteriales bacterium]
MGPGSPLQCRPGTSDDQGMNSLRRGALAVLTGSALAVAPAFVFSSAAAAAGPSVTVVSSKEYLDPFLGDVVAGELQNTGADPSGQVAVSVTWLDAAGHALGPASSLTNSTLDVLGPGDRSPFTHAVTPPAGWKSYTLTASPGATQEALNHNFTVTVTSRTTDVDGFHHLVGTVVNNNSVGADAVAVVATLYDSSGRADDQAIETMPAGTTLAPGASRSFDAISDASGRPFASLAITAQSPSTPAPSTPAAGTPAASTPTPTPTASPSSSPSPSSGPDVAPAVTLQNSVINAGQRVTVVYRGAPGSTLTILSRTQPATAFSVIGSVTLDGSGVGTSTHAPQKNTRITARTAGGVPSADQPLIQVRSVASLSSRRVAPGTYAFTGRVYPAHASRLVSLYRNGGLAAQGRCAADGTYTITKTLPAGGAGFFVRTGNDTYNLGATSRTVPLAVR